MRKSKFWFKFVVASITIFIVGLLLMLMNKALWHYFGGLLGLILVAITTFVCLVLTMFLVARIIGTPSLTHSIQWMSVMLIGVGFVTFTDANNFASVLLLSAVMVTMQVCVVLCCNYLKELVWYQQLDTKWQQQWWW